MIVALFILRVHTISGTTIFLNPTFFIKVKESAVLVSSKKAKENGKKSVAAGQGIIGAEDLSRNNSVGLLHKHT